MPQIKELIRTAEKDPLTPLEDSSHANPPSYASFKHRLDLRLRKVVGELPIRLKRNMGVISAKKKQLIQSIDTVSDELSLEDETIEAIASTFQRECLLLSIVHLKQVSYCKLRSAFSNSCFMNPSSTI